VIQEPTVPFASRTAIPRAPRPDDRFTGCESVDHRVVSAGASHGGGESAKRILSGSSGLIISAATVEVSISRSFSSKFRNGSSLRPPCVGDGGSLPGGWRAGRLEGADVDHSRQQSSATAAMVRHRFGADAAAVAMLRSRMSASACAAPRDLATRIVRLRWCPSKLPHLVSHHRKRLQHLRCA